jgi:hypothetical protein
MKTFLILFLGSTVAFAATSSRIKDISTTATSPASDDFMAVDGTASGTRKMLPGGVVVRPNSAMAAFVISTSNRITNTKTLADTTATLTFSAAPTAGTTFYLTLTGHSSACTVTIPSSYSVGQQATITSFVMPANGKAELSWRYDGTTYFLVGEPGPLTITNPAAATTLTIASGSSLTTEGAYTSTITFSANSTITMPTAGTVVSNNSTSTLTEKTFDASASGNVLKQYGYIYLTHPTVFGSAVTQQTTVTSPLYGQAKFADDVETNNYIEYVLAVPRDIDTSVDLTAEFHFILGGADTADHDYIIEMIDIAPSAVYDTATGDAVNLTYTADGNGADKDLQRAGAPDTLTGWKSALTAGSFWRIRITRDGDDGTNDASTVDSYSAGLVIRYGITQ